MTRIFGRFAKYTYLVAVLLGAITFRVVADNYTLTQGAGTTFGSHVVSTVNYPMNMICDFTTGTQCATVSAGGAVKVDGSAVTQPVSGTVTAAQATAANLNATVVQGTAANLLTQVSQPTAASLNATVVQGTAANLLATVSQGGNWSVRNLGNAGATLDFNTGGTGQTAPGAALLTGGQFLSAPPTLTTGQTLPFMLDSSGKLIVNCATGCSASTNITQWASTTLGAATTYGTAPTGNAPGVNAFVTNALGPGAALAANSGPTVNAIDQVPSTTGNIVANNITPVVVNAAATTLYGVQVFGIGSAPAYLKIYNATSATCGSGTPVKRIMIPAAGTAANGAGSVIEFALGVRLSTGLTYCVTTGITDADTTAPAASTYLVNLDWR